MADVLIFRPVVIYELYWCQVFNKNSTLTGTQRSFTKRSIWDKLGNFCQNHPETMIIR